MSGKDVRVVELFAGVGGFRCGLERASPRFKTIWANQWEPGSSKQHAFQCYVSHYGESKDHVNEDIAVAKERVPEHDLLVGGFPCQDYSVARTKAEGIVGKKGVLWWSIDSIISKMRPPYILLENVDRLLRSPSTQRGRDFAIILRCLFNKGYMVEWRVINAAEYGEPQKRRRTFIFAYKKGTAMYDRSADKRFDDIVMKEGFFAKGFPVKGSTEEKFDIISIKKKKYPSLVDISNDFQGTFYNAGVMRNGEVYTRRCEPDHNGEQKTLGGVLSESVDEKYFVPDIEKWIYMKGKKREERTRRSDGGKYYYSEGSIPFPDRLDIPGRTMLTSEGKVNRSSHIIKNGDGFRILTPEECERLNGFDAGWTKDIPEPARYFTMGNALVVPLIERMGRVLDELL